MVKYSNDDLGLIFVLKVGYNSKDQGLYELIFSHDITNVDTILWNWDISPACDNCVPPTEDFVDRIINLKTNAFDLVCLHDAVDRPYSHGYNTIHALAYEEERDDDGFVQYDNLMNADETPLLVFHYGMSLQQIIDMFKLRNIILKGNDFIEASEVKFE